MPDTPMTPDLDAIRERLKDVYRPTFGLTKWSSDIGLHFAANTANITPERADRLTWAITFVPADVAALMAWGEHLAAEVEQLRAENTELRNQVSLAADDLEAINVAYEVGYANGKRDSQEGTK